MEKPLLISSILFLLSLSSSAAAGTYPLGSSISAANSNSSWSSPSITFLLTFIPSPSSPSLFLPAITFSGGLPVWSPLPSSSSSGVSSYATLSLSSSGNLVLSNSSSSSPIWQSNTTNSGVTSASLDDTGNLRLLTSRSRIVWQSFDHPSDTLLQSQNLTSSQSLVSGPYTFSLTPAGNLTLRWSVSTNNITYFNKLGLNASLSNTSLSSPVLALQNNGIVSLLDAKLSQSAVIAYSSDYGETDNLRFLRLDNDGNFRAYSASRGNAQPTVRWAVVSDQCEVFGWCGNMGICSYNDTSPVCGCPSLNFEPVDSSDTSKGCKRKVELSDCPGNSTMLQLENTQFLTYPPETSSEQFFVGITACRQNCLSGTSCVAATALSDGSGLCYLKVSNFVSGYQSSALPSSSYVKVCAPTMPNPVGGDSGETGSDSSKLKGWVVAVVVVGTVVGLMVLEAGLFLCIYVCIFSSLVRV